MEMPDGFSRHLGDVCHSAQRFLGFAALVAAAEKAGATLPCPSEEDVRLARDALITGVALVDELDGEESRRASVERAEPLAMCGHSGVGWRDLAAAVLRGMRDVLVVPEIGGPLAWEESRGFLCGVFVSKYRDFDAERLVAGIRLEVAHCGNGGRPANRRPPKKTLCGPTTPERRVRTEKEIADAIRSLPRGSTGNGVAVKAGCSERTVRRSNAWAGRWAIWNGEPVGEILPDEWLDLKAFVSATKGLLHHKTRGKVERLLSTPDSHDRLIDHLANVSRELESRGKTLQEQPGQVAKEVLRYAAEQASVRPKPDKCPA